MQNEKNQIIKFSKIPTSKADEKKNMKCSPRDKIQSKKMKVSKMERKIQETKK